MKIKLQYKILQLIKLIFSLNFRDKKLLLSTDLLFILYYILLYTYILLYNDL